MNELDESFTKSIKPLRRPKEYSDGDGLALIVLPDNTKFWVFRHKTKDVKLEGEIGRYPKISLDTARQLKDAMKLMFKYDLDISSFKSWPKPSSPQSKKRESTPVNNLPNTQAHLHNRKNSIQPSL